MKKANFNPGWFLVLIPLLMFHGCVIKTQRGMQARQCVYDSQTQNDQCRQNITYFTALRDIKEVFKAWD